VADPGRVARWRRELSALAGFKIGINWEGNPRHDTAPVRRRAIPLAQFAPLGRLPDVRLINLQKGPGAEQLAQVREAFPVTDLGDRLDPTGGAFLDTAAVMKSLDLVVTSDTAIAHLAGGLGVPVWVALPAVPDWRWLLDREDTPWYPTMRLFRQKQSGDWDEVFQRLTAAVSALLL
jgi:hypothetical protein